MKGIFYIVINCIIITLSIVICAFVDNNFELANIHFYLFFFLCIIDFFRYKTITFQLLWLGSFIFIILSEMLLREYLLTMYEWEHKFIFLANDAVLLGYHLTQRKKNIITENREVKGKSWKFIFFALSFYIIFMIYQIPRAYISMQIGGRSYSDDVQSSNILLSTLMSCYRVMPLIIGYYIVRIRNKSKWLALLLSAPVFFLMLFNGSRFRLLFTLLPFLLICDFFRVSNITFKNMIMLFLVVFVLIFINTFMRQTRNVGIGGYQADDTEEIYSQGDHLSVKVCKYGSPEGIIPIMHYIKTEVETNGYTYGKSLGYLFYFWVPRIIWPDKPVMLNSWIPKKYMTGISEGYSSSSGFCGEPFADFGYFSFIIFILMGYGLKKADNYLLGTEYGRKRCVHSLLALLLIPYIPFIIRSPVTATISTIMNSLFVYVFYILFFKVKNGTSTH